MAAGDTLATFKAQDNEPPASNFATSDTRDATYPHPVLDFALNEEAVVAFIMPRHYAGGGITISVEYAMSTATTDEVKLETAIERHIDGTTNLDTDSFAAAQNSGDVTVPTTPAGKIGIITTTHTDGAQMDSLAVGEGARLKIKRVTASTDASGDLELRFVEIQETP